MDLRDYQEQALAASIKEYHAGVTRQLVALPTGTGKTVLFAALAMQLNVPTLIIAHRDELLSQAKKKLLMFWPDVDVGIVKAKQNEINRQVVIASVQTISRPRRLQQLQERDFSLMIIDEAHHSISPSYQTVIRELGFMDSNPDKLLVGVTATPTRGDKLGLDTVFQKIVYQRSLLEMIRQGYLVDLKAIRVKAEIDLKRVHTRAGDFAGNELEAAVNTANMNQIVVKSFTQYAKGRKAAAFCAGVAHAKDLAKVFEQAGIRAAPVWGDMDAGDRKKALAAYEAGEIQVLTNCEILTEGWDSPATDCLLMIRPTKSGALYQQMVGRGTRLYPNKKNCLILEFTANRHDIATLGSITGLPVKHKQTVLQAVKEQEQRQQEEAAKGTAGHVIGVEYDILDRSEFRWFEVGNDWRLPVGIGKYIQLKFLKANCYDVMLIDGDNCRRLSSSFIDLGYAQGIGEDYARKHGKVFASRNAPWTQKPASEKQIEALERMRISYPPDMTSGQAADLIGAEMAKRDAQGKEPATPQQIYRLRKEGFKVSGDLTRAEAYKMFKQLKDRQTVKTM